MRPASGNSSCLKWLSPKQEILLKKRHTAYFFYQLKVCCVSCFIYHHVELPGNAIPLDEPGSVWKLCSNVHCNRMRCPQFTSLSLRYKWWGCSVWLLSAVLLLSPACSCRDKGLSALCSCAYRHALAYVWKWAQYVWVYILVRVCVCVCRAVIWVFNCLFVCALLWGFVDA